MLEKLNATKTTGEIFARFCDFAKNKIASLSHFLSHDIENIRSLLKSIEDDNYNKIKYVFVETNLLPVSITTMINPLFENLHNISMYEIRPAISLTIVPLREKSLVCISWIEEHESAVSGFLGLIDKYSWVIIK